MLVEPRSDEEPYLVQNDRQGQQEAGQEGDLEVSEEGLRQAGVDQSLPRRENIDKGVRYELEESFVKGVADAKARTDGNGGDHQALPQFGHVGHKGHARYVEPCRFF